MQRHGAHVALILLCAAMAPSPCVAAGKTAGGPAPKILYWHCGDASLEGTGFPGCQEVAQSLRIELASAAISVVEAPESATAAGPAPADPPVLASGSGALFVAWVEPGKDGQGFLLNAYDALNGQVLSKMVSPDGEGGSQGAILDADSIAFLYRNMLGTSLYADLDTIGSEAGLLALAFPEEKVKLVKKAVGMGAEPGAGQQPSWFVVSLLYDVLVFPLEPVAWHAIAIDLGFRLHRIVELTLDVAVTPVPVTRRNLGVRLDLRLVPIQLGLRVSAVQAGPFVLLPGAGLGLAFSSSVISGGQTAGSGADGRTDLRGSAFVSILARFWIHRRVGIAVEAGGEVLFNQQSFCVETSAAACEPLLSPGMFGIFFRAGISFR